MRPRLAPLLALAAIAGCGDPGVTACVARCQSFTLDPTMCQTMCTRSCAELRQSFGIDEDTCRQMQENARVPAAPAPPPEPTATPTPAAPDPTARCGEFVAFAFSCGIGRPARDPTVDLGVQTNNDLVIQQGVVAECERARPPYDPALIACFAAAAPDCDAYKKCADAAVQARDR